MVSKEDKQQIFDLVEERSWAQVISAVKCNPDLAKCTLEKNGAESLVMSGTSQSNLILHEACKCQPSIETVEAILRAYPDSVKVRGQWGYLPLHYAAASGASKQVLEMLLERHSAGTRTRDDYDGVFPIHLACKWGADKECLLAIMVVYPEGVYVRDNHGKTPKCHADNLPTSASKQAIMEALRMGPMLCACSKASQGRIGDETESKLRGMAEAHSTHMKRLEQKRVDERDTQRKTIETLKTSLQSVTSEFTIFQQDLENLKGESAALKKSKEAVEEVLRSERKQHETKITDVLGTIEKNRMENVEKLAEKDTEIAALKAVVDEKQAKIESIEAKLQTAEEERDSWKAATEEEKALTAKLNGEIEELSVFPGMVKDREATIKELEVRIQVHEKAEHTLATNSVLLQKARNEAEHDLRVALAERDSIRSRKDEVQRDLSDAKKHIESYKNRMSNLHGWVQNLSSDMESWNVMDFLPAGSVDSGVSSASGSASASASSKTAAVMPQEEKKEDDMVPTDVVVEQ